MPSRTPGAHVSSHLQPSGGRKKTAGHSTDFGRLRKCNGGSWGSSYGASTDSGKSRESGGYEFGRDRCRSVSASAAGARVMDRRRHPQPGVLEMPAAKSGVLQKLLAPSTVPRRRIECHGGNSRVGPRTRLPRAVDQCSRPFGTPGHDDVAPGQAARSVGPSFEPFLIIPRPTGRSSVDSADGSVGGRFLAHDLHELLHLEPSCVWTGGRGGAVISGQLAITACTSPPFASLTRTAFL